MSPDPLQLLTLAEVAGLLLMSESWVLAEIKAGRMGYRLVGSRSIRLTRSDVADFIDAAERGPKVQLAEVHDIRPLQVA